jgi:nicotinamide riboside kinase
VYEDVEHIARIQQASLAEAQSSGTRIIILDTFLVITRVWFLEVFRRVPQWMDQALKQAEIDLFLLCYHDLEWIPDQVRENPGERRAYLFDRYAEEIDRYGIPCEIIKGLGQQRYNAALSAINRHFPLPTTDRDG